ncbi:MAG: hypothetical protein EPN97_01980 [Alphaproteobacteria bacterium]|nr:MAG: hypothetical protein EPN97_01980 [Alphaproteobacteria bacterium]
MTRDEWMAGLPGLAQDKKDHLLFFAVENLEYEKVDALIKAGAKVNGGQDMFGWILKRTDDMQMTNVLLDAGWTAETVRHRDCWAFFGEDKDEAYKTLGRLFNAGMTDDERIKAAASALKKGDFVHLDAYIIRPGENIVKLLNYPDWGRQTVAWDKDDMRDITQDDIDKYIGWRHSIEELYAAHFATGMDEKKLKEAVTKEGMTGLMLAARVGKMDDVAAFYRNRPDLALGPSEVTRQDCYAQSVVSLLGQRQQLQGLFAPEFWRGAPEDALELLSQVPQMYLQQLDQVKIARDVAQSRLAKTAAAAKHSI